MDEIFSKLGAQDYATRREARRALMLSNEDVVPILISGLKHENRQVRKNCAELMDHVADERCVAPLADALEDPIADVRRHALHSLICDECKTVPLDVDAIGLVIERATEDPSIRVRRKATTTLAILPTWDERTLKALENLTLDEDAEVRRRAAWSLERCRNRALMRTA